jgi:hypothetical protein
MDIPEPQPPTSSSARTPGLALLVVGILLTFVVVAAITGLIARQWTRESAQSTATVATLQKDVESLRGQVRNLMADSDRTAVLPLAERVYFPVRTNGGTLLMAVAGVEEVGNGLRVHLSIGNPHSMTYKGFTLSFVWDKGKGTGVFADVLAPGTWTVVTVMLSPADPAGTKSLTITSASVDEIPVR